MSARQGTRQVATQFVERGIATSQFDEVAVEEPLEIRVAGDALALTMRTPGDDRSLALGFLFAEGVIGSLADVGSVYVCGRSDDPGYGHTLEIAPGPGARLPSERLARTRRTFATSSACGVCGRTSIADLLSRCPPRAELHAVPGALIAQATALLSLDQPHFARTGGLHAACAIDPHGRVVASAEDVGRHNAVDKVVGRLLLAGALPGRTSDEQGGSVLAVSGRASFEIVQKAAMAGFACVASISAPSSLAIETAEATGVILAAFVRGERYSLYSHASRVL